MSRISLKPGFVKCDSENVPEVEIRAIELLRYTVSVVNSLLIQTLMFLN